MLSRVLNATPDILIAYDDFRRRENDTLLELADLLPRIDGLPPEVIEQARDAVFHSDHPFLLVLIGPFGSGKSSLINALLGDEVLPTGPIPTTEQIIILRYGEATGSAKSQTGTETIFHPASLLKQISLVDTPGLESVFARHSERTDAFLHRSDWVVVVMLATQALSASHLKYLEALRDYGKRVIVVVNQVDLLDDAQRETVSAFVREQVLMHLSAEPEVFLTSARQGLAARRADSPDEDGWQASGMAALEQHITGSLDDRERLRQKLQTPLQIARNVIAEARAQVQTHQRALDEHRSVQENIAGQIAAAGRQQKSQVEALLTDVSAAFAEAATRGEETVRELFQLARALSQVTAGLGELIGLAGLARRFGGRSRAASAFQANEVLAPLDDLSRLFNDLGPRLEGRDLQDMDELAVYTNNAIDTLPETLQSKIIGEVRPPVTYNREPLRKIRGDLDDLVSQARHVETGRLDRSVRNALVMLAGWQVAVIIALVLVVGSVSFEDNVLLPILLVLGTLALMFLGVGLMTLRGTLLARTYGRRMFDLSQGYQDTFRQAAGEQIEYGLRLRADMVAPFTRLIDAQTALQAEASSELRDVEDKLAAFAGEIGAFWQSESERKVQQDVR